MAENVKEEKELTPEEYAKARETAMEHLKKEIEYLKVEKEYEDLVADLEEAKTRGVVAIAQRAQFFARQQAAAAAQEEAPQGEPTDTENKPPRKLKQD